MASILDQFEEASQKFTLPRSKQGVPNKEDDNSLIFSRSHVDFFPSDNIIQLCACNDIILIATSNNVLQRINVRQPDVPSEIDLTKYNSSMKMSGAFLSPDGQHALIIMVPKLAEPQSEFLYLSRHSIKLKPLSRFRGVEITAVAWSTWQQNSNTSGPVLLGTSRGLLIETEVGGDADGIFTTSVADYKQLFDIGKGGLCPITGLHMYRSAERCHVLATTANKIYHFHATVTNQDEKPMLQQVFRRYLSEPERFESIKTTSKTSRLDVFTDKDSKLSFGWLTGLGLYFGQAPNEDEALLSNSEIIQYPDGFPLDFILTGYHVLFVYRSHVTFIRLLTHKTIFQDFFTAVDGSDSDLHSRPKRVIREPNRGKIYVFTDRSVYTYKVRREDRDVWLEYVERGEFDRARDHCRDNPVSLDRITTRQADALFNDEDYELSAYYYSQSLSISFEEVALKFLRAGQSSPLMRFLRLRLESLLADDTMQRTMLVVWLVELYLSKLGKCDKQSPEHACLQTEFEELLSSPQVAECVTKNKGTIYDLMAAHGDTVNLIKLSIANLDYERVIRQHLFKGEYQDALQVIKQSLPARKEILYTFAPSLITHLPASLVQLIIQMASYLDPSRLLPALIQAYDSGEAARDVAQYLQYCVDARPSCTDQSLHNLLLAIYVRHQPDRLRLYLAQQGQDPSCVNYDIHFALRLCQEKGLTEACVQLSALLGLWTAAVELALTVNVELAVQTANMNRSDPDLLKTLWLKIAEHVVKEKHDIKAAMEFLKKCPLLKIEDILPFFPDFVTIDDFKSAICSSLQEYRQHIQDLKDEMEESSKSAELIVQEMSVMKNRHIVVRWSDVCSHCGLQLLMSPFYVFPCTHHHHISCLQELVQPHLPPVISQRLIDLQRQLSNERRNDTNNAVSNSTTTRDLVQSSIDAVLANECPLCGDAMVDSIDKPFIPDDAFDQVLKEWA